MKIKIFIISTLIAIVSIQYSFAQMECRSTLGAHLTPFKKDVPILWAIEGTTAPGFMTSPFSGNDKTKLRGGMLIAALDFTIKKKHNIYLEGGYKNWVNSEFVNDNAFSSKHFGMRQVFYAFSGKTLKIKVGLHETKLGDFFLIDERIMGTSIDKEIGAFTINLRAGTVTKSFARMGKFCSNRHLYGVINPNYTENIGKKIGETNLVGIAFNWNPQYKKPEVTKTESDEFETSGEFNENDDSNEFGDSDEFANEKKLKPKQKLSITNIGIVAYTEFGNNKYIPDNKLYTGLLVDMNLPFGFFMQAGAVYQSMAKNNATVYIAKLGKSKTWNNASNTKLSGAFIGKYNFDKDALFQPLFSNLFIGEIMRMDATEFPLWQAEIKHRFPGKMKFHIAFKAVGQIEDAKTNEQDIEFGFIAFKKHLKFTLIGSRVESQAIGIDNEFYMVRMELRLAF